ncbi:aspartate aminotransferase family protein [Persicobacter psychrovividus]|uniref:Acetylornithine aminotransferase n=1 Tax=Persicobacter psychrovividus TaxID=387638 RepID=A0ABN6LFF0_9BACT|nr:acetylornithine aminotransferase [Persicobacter psychrovividus]
MNLFDVYPLLPITLTHGEMCRVFDNQGNAYYDLYGGHAVISIGHSHPHYLQRLQEQMRKIGYYSNSVGIPIQQQVADKLGKLSNYDEHQLFFCNSGAEAVENALKLASFHTGKSEVIAFKKGFHGRTSGAVAVTDNPKIQAPFNQCHQVSFHEVEQVDTVRERLEAGNVAAIIIEGIRGVGGIYVPSSWFMQSLRNLADKYEALLIIDEIQSGFGRSGKFFAHQHQNIKADIITMAKGMGNGFPVGGILIDQKIKASFGLLGTTYGGNHLACAATLAVLEVIEEEELMAHVATAGAEWKSALAQCPGVVSVEGEGFMLGINFDFPIKDIRRQLALDRYILTGVSANPNQIRLLPTLNLGKASMDHFVDQLTQAVKSLELV